MWNIKLLSVKSFQILTQNIYCICGALHRTPFRPWFPDVCTSLLLCLQSMFVKKKKKTQLLNADVITSQSPAPWRLVKKVMKWAVLPQSVDFFNYHHAGNELQLLVDFSFHFLQLAVYHHDLLKAMFISAANLAMKWGPWRLPESMKRVHPGERFNLSEITTTTTN